MFCFYVLVAFFINAIILALVALAVERFIELKPHINRYFAKRFLKLKRVFFPSKSRRSSWRAAFNRLLRNQFGLQFLPFVSILTKKSRNIFNYIHFSWTQYLKNLWFFSFFIWQNIKAKIKKQGVTNTQITVEFTKMFKIFTTTTLNTSVKLNILLTSLLNTLYNIIEINSTIVLLQNFFNRVNFNFFYFLLFLNNKIKFKTPITITSTNFFVLLKNFTVFRANITIPQAYVFSLLSIYKNCRTFILPSILSIIFFVILLDYFSVDFLRQCAVWAVFGFLGFWLFSSFNFFIKRYRFGKFTSAIQRFWKRTNVYFWVIEGFLFGLFFYYYLNSSQEPLYMYDESSLNQQYLTNLIASYQSYLMLLFIFFYTLYLLLSLPTFKSRQQIIHLGLMTLAYTYIFLVENYQVYYLLTSFYENYWVYDAEQAVWSLEIEVPRIRTKQQYFLIALVLKYWHFIFIYLSWLFFVMKSFEKKQITYALLGLSSQNIIILFVLNILFNAQWIKWCIKRFSETAYYWFFTAFNEFTLLDFLKEIIVNVCFTHGETNKHYRKKFLSTMLRNLFYRTSAYKKIPIYN